MAHEGETLSQAPGLPSQGSNRMDAQGPVTEKSIADETREFHWRGLRSRRHRDLTAEKYVLHVDGEGGSQWYDLYHGQRLKIPANLSGVPRIQNNQLRPITDNFVAHLTTQPYRFVVEPPSSREDRESAVIDQALMNHVVRMQRWNALMAEAKYMAACYGTCPIHAAWRDDVNGDPYEAVAAQDEMGNPMISPKPGAVDNWVGNPFDHVFDSGARRHSIHRQTFGRVLPAQMVRDAFGRPDIEGNERIPSASMFQRVVQKWTQAGGDVHGSAVLTPGWGHDELIGVIYDEILPGTDPSWPNGRLAIVALQGSAATSRDEAHGGIGTPVLLWVGDLPAAAFSSVQVYSHHRMDDPLGKPFVADIDDDQIQLNQLESLVNEYLRRASRPPLASSGAVNVDTISFRGDTLLEVEQLGAGSLELQYLEYPARHITLLESKISRVLDGMYRKGGWQAASRGEMKGSGKAIIALQQADDSIFGPIVQRTREELEAFARLNWKLHKQYMDVPDIIDIVGDEQGHIAESYVSRVQMSERPPVFTLVSGFGTSTEARAQQLMNMFGMVDQRGEQVLGTRELRKNWPDQSLFRQIDDPQEVRDRRPLVINNTIRRVATMIRQQFPQIQGGMRDPMVQQAAMMGAQEVDQRHPTLMDDELERHIDILSVITQDETEDPLARQVAVFRQQQFWQWLAQKHAAQAERAAEQQARAGAIKEEDKEQPAPKRSQAAGSTEQAFNPVGEAGTPSARSMQTADRAFANRVRAM
jgi:hypothetical protein